MRLLILVIMTPATYVSGTLRKLMLEKIYIPIYQTLVTVNTERKPRGINVKKLVKHNL